MIDVRVRAAVFEAAKDLNQPLVVAERIVSWLEALSEGNEQINDRDETKRRCERIYDAVTVPEAQINEES